MALYELDDVAPKFEGRGPAFVAEDARIIGNVTLCEGHQHLVRLRAARRQ